MLSIEQLNSIKYEDVKHITSAEYFSEDEYASAMFDTKYCIKYDSDGAVCTSDDYTYCETPADVFYRVASGLAEMEEIEENKIFYRDKWFALMWLGWFRPGGSVLAGVDYPTKKSLLNCTSLPLEEDTLESIAKCDYTIMKCAAFRQGLGFDASNLRPRGAKVNNAAEESTGAIPWIEKLVDNGSYVGQCLHGDSLVLTTNGDYVKIKDVVKNKITLNIEAENTLAKVTDWFTNEPKTIFKVTTEYGDFIKSSEDHEYRVVNKSGICKKKLKHLDLDNDFLLSRRVSIDKPYVKIKEFKYTKSSYNKSNRLYIPERLPSVFNEDLAYLCGNIYGEGSFYNGALELALADNLPDCTAKINTCLQNIFNASIGDYGFNIKKGDGAVKKLSLGKFVTSFLKHVGIEKQLGGSLIFPEVIKNSPKSVVLSFFAGLFDADRYNSMSKKNIDLTLIDPLFLYDLKLQLARCGIITRFSKRRTRTQCKNCRTFYKLSIVGKRSGFLIENCGSVKLSKGNIYGKYDLLKTPYTLKDLDIEGKGKIKAVSYGHFITDTLYESLTGEITDYYLQKITNIEKEAVVSKTYDITVNNTSHMFLANNIIVSNSGRMPALLVSLKDHHPDIFEFVTSKVEKGKIENANISVQISNAFMEAVKTDSDWELYFDFEKDSKYERISKIVKAKELFELIASTAYSSAEPGIQYLDALRDGYMVHQVYRDTMDERFKGISTNACCFTGDTSVVTSKGSVTFEELRGLLKKGEEVKALCRDIKSDKWFFKPITNFFTRNEGAPVEVIGLTFEDGTYLECTPDHKFYSKNNKLIKAGELHEGTPVVKMLSRTGYEKYLRVSSVKQIQDKKVTYNIEVQDFHNYVVNEVSVKNSEKFLSPYNVCNLLSPNHEMFSTKEEEYKQELSFIVPYMTRMSDNVVTYELENKLSPLKEQAWILNQTRELGLGITNIHGWLLKQDLAYDSDEAIIATSNFFKNYACSVFKASIFLGEEKGSAPGFSRVSSTEAFMKSTYFRNVVDELFEGDYTKVTSMRNLAHMSVAPTGSLSNTFPKPCFSYGVEPVTGAYWWRRTRAIDKGIYTHYFIIPKKIQDYVLNKLEIDSDDYQELNAFNGSVLDNDGKVGLKLADIIDRNLPEGFFKPAHRIDYKQKIKLMAEMYKWVDAAISCTYNLPASSTIEDVYNIYMLAYDKGVRAVSVYIEGSREGILIFNDPKTNEAKYTKKSICDSNARPTCIVPNCAPKRPKEIPCDIIQTSVKGETWIVLIGLLDGNPYEIFCGSAKDLYLPKACKEGIIRKQDKGMYELEVAIRRSPVVYKDLANILMDGEEEKILTRLFSLMLRHGILPRYISEQLKKSNGSITAFSTAISRVLSRYVGTYSLKEGENKCPICGENSLIFSEGCIKCIECSYSRCG